MAFRCECFFYGAMPVLCHETTFRGFRADSHLRNCFSKKNSIASELPFSKKKSSYANGEMVYTCLVKKDCEDTGGGTKGCITYLPRRVFKKS
jgi:hypothetical protein